MKKLLAVLICVTMAVCLFPTEVYAVDDVGTLSFAQVSNVYGLYRSNGTEFEGRGTTWDVSEPDDYSGDYTLYLTNFHYSTAAYCALYIGSGCKLETIEISGDNSITSTCSTADSYGISYDREFSIQGKTDKSTDRLTVTGGNVADITQHDSYGFRSGSGYPLTIKDKATVIAAGGSNARQGFGIKGGKIDVYGDLTAIGGDSTCTAGWGIFSTSDYKINVMGGSLTAKGNTAACNKAPVLSRGSTAATASGSYDGSSPVESYNASDIANYKYLQIAAPTPLTFTDSASYDVPAGAIETAITPIDVSGAVSGGVSPYHFYGHSMEGYSIIDFPEWLSINASTGIITGTRPAVATAATTAEILMCDYNYTVKKITINIGAVTATPPAPPAPSGGTAGEYTTTVFNNPSSVNGTVQMSGVGINAADELITEPKTSGSAYNAMRTLTDMQNIIGCYEISLRSGTKSFANPMYLTFNLNSLTSGQDYTLVHKKANGSNEYFHATADLNGAVSFGPLYELSPFMLVKGKIAANPETGANDFVGIAAALSAVAAVSAAVICKKH